MLQTVHSEHRMHYDYDDESHRPHIVDQFVRRAKCRCGVCRLTFIPPAMCSPTANILNAWLATQKRLSHHFRKNSPRKHVGGLLDALMPKDQKIVQGERGWEQPTDKKRAQQTNQQDAKPR